MNFRWRFRLAEDESQSPWARGRGRDRVMSDTGTIVIPRGFRASAVKAGIKPSGGLDLALLAADGDCAAAGTFTTNRVCAAPVRWCRDHLPADDIRAIVINAGNANAATGEQGLANA